MRSSKTVSVISDSGKRRDLLSLLGSSVAGELSQLGVTWVELPEWRTQVKRVATVVTAFGSEPLNQTTVSSTPT